MTQWILVFLLTSSWSGSGYVGSDMMIVPTKEDCELISIEMEREFDLQGIRVRHVCIEVNINEE